jgi:hypothetical protein
MSKFTLLEVAFNHDLYFHQKMHIHVKRIQKRGEREEKRKHVYTDTYKDDRKEERKARKGITEAYGLVHIHGS